MEKIYLLLILIWGNIIIVSFYTKNIKKDSLLMRIITGDFKGRRLEMPENYNIRPTTEKVKEAIFSIIAANLEDAVCVDLFSGTGNLGLEALSRGAAKCYFCDYSRESLALIKRNIERCRAEEWSVIIPGDFERTLTRLGERGEKIDIFFLDPPYKKGLYQKCFELINEYGLLAYEGIIIAEHNVSDSLDDRIWGFEKIKERTYGTVAITIYG